MFKGVLEGGFLRAALKDVNQYGPHAMIMLLFVVATVTALALLLSATITPWFALQAVVFVFATVTAIALLLVPTLSLEIWSIVAALVFIFGSWTQRDRFFGVFRRSF